MTGQPGGIKSASFTSIRPAHGYSRIAPNLLNLVSPDPTKLSLFLQMISQTDAYCPEEGMYFIQSCYIYEGKHVLLSDGDWLPHTVADYMIADRVLSVLKNLIASQDIGKLESAPEPTVLIAKAGAGNYGHVLAEILPKLINLKHAGIRRFRLVLPKESAYFQGVIADISAALSLNVHIRFMNSAEFLSADSVYVFSPVSRHDALKSQTFLELRTVLRDLYKPQPSRRKQLFVTRGPNDSRRITNNARVSSKFCSFGFEEICPLDLDIPDQIRLFSNASRVAGSLGAGLSNIALAPEDCEVLMIDPGLGDFFFWDFACLVKQRFSWFFAGPFLGYSDHLSAADFTVDLGALDSALRLLFD